MFRLKARTVLGTASPLHAVSAGGVQVGLHRSPPVGAGSLASLSLNRSRHNQSHPFVELLSAPITPTNANERFLRLYPRPKRVSMEAHLTVSRLEQIVDNIRSDNAQVRPGIRRGLVRSYLLASPALDGVAVRKALAVLREAESEGRPLPWRSHCQVLARACWEGRLAEAWAVSSLLRRSGILPSPTEYALWIHALGRVGGHEVAANVLDSMSGAGGSLGTFLDTTSSGLVVSANWSCYHAMAGAYFEAGQYHESAAMIHRTLDSLEQTHAEWEKDKRKKRKKNAKPVGTAGVSRGNGYRLMVLHRLAERVGKEVSDESLVEGSLKVVGRFQLAPKS